MPGSSREWRLPKRALIMLLGATLGEEKAREVITEAAKSLGLWDDEYDREQTLQILERIAQQPDLVGIAARFVKSRVHLQWGSDRLLGGHHPE
jgi:hypothetical protein